MSKIGLKDLLGIDFPVIVAPMFLVSNTKMVLAAIESGATGAIPALNYRTTEELIAAIREIKSKTNKPFGINLIVNKSNIFFKKQLDVVCNEGVDFVITSLGSPEETINECHKHGVKVFCDVTDLKFAKKVEALGCDAIIAVNKEAGGHAGNISYKDLIPLLVENCSTPIISAGGVTTGQDIKKMLDMGVAGVSMGSVFIATDECDVTQEYKQACIDYGAKDIVMTTKLSGTPCTVINTPYVKSIGTEQGWLEKLLNRNKKLKKWVKAFVFSKGMKQLQKSAFSATYKTVWCAGPSIERVKEIRSIKTIFTELKQEFESVK
ncbi:MAG: nitronate monooxygenase [Crocinitomicaceae bacterium]|nr:nitronate monooxygenase [Crocinitomicaceae bacterium]